jgi:ABC-type transport system substrate-binding protein
MNKKLMFYSFLTIALFMLSSFAVTGQLAAGATAQTYSRPGQTRSDQWINDLQANYNNPQWFFTHLNATDRLMIRNAIDYATPRSAIINSIMDGFASPLATYQIPQVGKFYNSAVQPFDYNLTKASELLTTVFGYSWSPSDNPNTTYDESAPYFPITLMVPNSNPQRVQWGNLMNGIFDTIGIGSTIVEFSFTNIIQRVFESPDAQGWDFNHGGFDGLFIGLGGGVFPDDGSQWYQSSYVPNNNWQNVNSTYIDNLVEQENNQSLTAQQRLDYFYTMQQYVRDQSLTQILFQYLSPYAYVHGLTGMNPFYTFGGNYLYQNMTNPSNGNKAITIGSPSIYTDLNPLLSTDVYSNFISSQFYQGGLLSLSDQPNDPTFANYSIYANLAYSNYTLGPAIDASGNAITSAPQRYYNFTLRSGMTWADGTPVTANDVAFTYMQVLNPSRNSRYQGGTAYYLNNQTSIKVYDNTHIGFNLTRWADPFPFGESVFTLPVLPKAQFNIADWAKADSDTGNGFPKGTNNLAQYKSTFNGNGPYMLNYIDTTTGYANLTKNPNYNAALYGNVPGQNVSIGPQFVGIQVEKTPTAAIADLAAHIIDVADTTIGLTSIYATSIAPQIYNAATNPTGKFDELNATGASWQEFTLNQASPIWGYSPQDFTAAYLAATQVTTTATSAVSSSSTNTGTPFGDVYTIVGAIVAMGVINYTVRRRRKNI